MAPKVEYGCEDNERHEETAISLNKDNMKQMQSCKLERLLQKREPGISCITCKVNGNPCKVTEHQKLQKDCLKVEG